MMINSITATPYQAKFMGQKVKNIPNTAGKIGNAPEAFEGETELLKEVYNNYLKNMGGYKMVDGKMVHVTTILHIDKKVQNAMRAIEQRLIELGAIKPLPQIVPKIPNCIY